MGSSGSKISKKEYEAVLAKTEQLEITINNLENEKAALMKQGNDWEQRHTRTEQENQEQLKNYQLEKERWKAEMEARQNDFHNVLNDRVAEFEEIEATLNNEIIMLEERDLEKNYKKLYLECEVLKKHKADHPNSIYIQVLGKTGVGKSTFLNAVNQELSGNMELKNQINPLNSMTDDISDDEFETPNSHEIFKTGRKECTEKMQFLEITNNQSIQKIVVENPVCKNYRLWLVDQPGIGGVKVDSGNDNFLKKFSPGRFDFTLFLTNHRFDIDEFWLLNHLVCNSKDLIIVKSAMQLALNSEAKYTGPNMPTKQPVKYKKMIEKIKTEFSESIDQAFEKKGVHYEGETKREIFYNDSLNMKKDFDLTLIVQKILDTFVKNCNSKSEQAEHAKNLVKTKDPGMRKKKKDILKNFKF